MREKPRDPVSNPYFSNVFSLAPHTESSPGTLQWNSRMVLEPEADGGASAD